LFLGFVIGYYVSRSGLAKQLALISAIMLFVGSALYAIGLGDLLTISCPFVFSTDCTRPLAEQGVIYSYIAGILAVTGFVFVLSVAAYRVKKSISYWLKTPW